MSPGHRELVRPWVEFLGRWPWDWFGTFTFRGEYVHPEAADKRWRVWVSKANRVLYGTRWWKHGKGIRWVRALETQRRGVLHYHALLGDVADLRRLTWMDRWDELAGYARITPVESAAAVTAYCAKYVTKGGELDLGGPFAQVALPLPEVLRPPLRLEPPAAHLVEPGPPDPDPTWAQGELPTLERQPGLPLLYAGLVVGARGRPAGTDRA